MDREGESRRGTGERGRVVTEWSWKNKSSSSQSVIHGCSACFPAAHFQPTDPRGCHHCICLCLTRGSPALQPKQITSYQTCWFLPSQKHQFNNLSSKHFELLFYWTVQHQVRLKCMQPVTLDTRGHSLRILVVKAYISWCWHSKGLKRIRLTGSLSVCL